jgi:hypothetical protein
LPDHVATSHTAIFSDDDAIRAFAAAAKAAAMPLPARYGTAGGERLFDLRHMRDLAQLQAQWIEPVLADLRDGQVARVTLDFADDVRFVIRAGQRWRFWRRPLRSIAA